MTTSRRSFTQYSLLLGLFTAPFLSLRVGNYTISDFLLSISFIFTIFKPKSIHYQRSTLNAHINLLAFCVALSSLVTTFLNPDPVNGLLVSLRFVFLTFCLPWTFLRNFQTVEARKMPLRFLHFGILLFAGSVIFSAVNSESTISSLNRNFGLAQHPTDAGGFLALGTVLSFNYLQQYQGFWNLISIGFLFLATLLTGSISSLLAIAIGVTFILFQFSKSQLEIRAKLAFVTLLTLMLTCTAIFYNFDILGIASRFQSATSGRYDTVLIRFQNYSESISSILKNLPNLLFGHGLGQGQSIVQSQITVSYAPHNYLLQMLYQGGFFFTVLILAYQAHVYKLLKKTKDFESFTLQTLVASQVFFGMTSPVMFTRYLWIPFILSAIYINT